MVSWLFHGRDQGVMRNFSGIEGIPFERIELPNKAETRGKNAE